MSVTLPPLSDVDFRQLRIFRTIVESNGFTAAQDELGISRSTISTQMSALETRLGVKLCRRGRSGFSLTEHGQKIYSEVIKLFAAADSFRAEVGAIRGNMVGELRIGVVDAMVENPNCKLDRAIALFHERAPGVHPTFVVVSPNQIENALLSRQMEIAVMPNQPMNAAVQMQQLFHEEQTMYCGKEHPLFEKAHEKMPIEQLAEQKYARRGYSVALAFQSLFKHPPSATAYDMEGLAYLIRSGKFVSFLPTHFARQWVERGEMRALRPDLLSFKIAMCVANFPQSVMSRMARVFRECLIEVHPTVTAIKTVPPTLEKTAASSSQ
ncbi:LysR family transcriptional regulator [Thalassospira profundimaris]|uniref:LysR family transcriptional regulator n=1 Tax=Thalassospira profundimaris TaxID=502049 RepID=UPI00028735BF|nr:LysR family transcriptional regulator [Thalassospira profundimaris]EKF07339.1 putative LysR-family regulatory protein [Thalassospira profundimaris WP0211]